MKPMHNDKPCDARRGAIQAKQVGQPTARVVNALTVDVEDWVQSVLDPDLPLTDNFVRNTHDILELLERCGVRATFFVLGLAAERAPGLVRDIQAGGHEIQSHGYGHRLLHTLTRDQIALDIARSKRLLEDITGVAVTAYRAPAFSITRDNPWVLDVLLECGYAIDASIMAARTRRYGIAGAPWFPHRLRTPGGGTIVEVPVATTTIFGRRVPVGGGGYLRLLPARWVGRCIGAINRQGHPSAVYMHPYEFNPSELAGLSHSVSLRKRLHQGLGRGSFKRKIGYLLSAYAFGTLEESLGGAALPLHDPDWAMRAAPRSGIERATVQPAAPQVPTIGT